MFEQDALNVAEHLLINQDWTYFGCLSFEPRWDAFARAVGAIACPRFSVVLFPDDDKSTWRAECNARQNASWATSPVNARWHASQAALTLPQPAPWNSARDALHALLQQAGNHGRKLVIDISAMPRACFIPAIATALQIASVEDLVVIYCEPRGYGSGMLASEPTPPTILPPFDWIPSSSGGKQSIGWIPILGFGPSFATTLHDALVDSYDLRGRVFPLLGFPAFEPRFFDRSLAESGRAILDGLQAEPALRDHFFYAASDDPFETREAIRRLVTRLSPDIHWIGSPMGPKPMALGMALAALDHKMSIMVSQARSYNPDYSHGVGRLHAYLLKLGGARCY